MNLANQYCHFFEDDEFIETDRPGFRRRVLTGDNLQLCFWRIAGGATGSYLHKHDEHEQLGIIVRGALDFLIDGDSENQNNTKEKRHPHGKARPLPRTGGHNVPHVEAESNHTTKIHQNYPDCTNTSPLTMPTLKNKPQTRNR